MLKIIVCVKDNVAEVFHDPHIEVNTASAIRSFTQSAQDQVHKDDFSLYQIGSYNTDNGQIIANEPLRIFSGHDIKPDNVVDLPENLKKQSGAN